VVVLKVPGWLGSRGGGEAGKGRSPEHPRLIIEALARWLAGLACYGPTAIIIIG
jgi:hypothetical protein